jgi:ketosteroid isomerase-like protein
VTLSIAPISQVLTAYQAAVHAKDIDAFVALYDADVRIFDMWGQWSLNGIDAGHDVAAAHAFLTFTGLSAEGKELRSMTNRLTMVLRRTGDGWKIVHEHTSAPIDHGSLKAILRREPSA